MQIIEFGTGVRVTAQNGTNVDSSRSHAILQISLKNGKRLLNQTKISNNSKNNIFLNLNKLNFFQKLYKIQLNIHKKIIIVNKQLLITYNYAINIYIYITEFNYINSLMQYKFNNITKQIHI